MKLRKKQLPSPRVRRMLLYCVCRLLILATKTWLPFAYSAGNMPTLSTVYTSSTQLTLECACAGAAVGLHIQVGVVHNRSGAAQVSLVQNDQHLQYCLPISHCIHLLSLNTHLTIAFSTTCCWDAAVARAPLLLWHHCFKILPLCVVSQRHKAALLQASPAFSASNDSLSPMYGLLLSDSLMWVNSTHSMPQEPIRTAAAVATSCWTCFTVK